MNNFILTYNPFAAFPGEARLRNHVEINRYVDQFHQPYPGTYLLKSKEGVFTLNESFRGLFQETAYTVAVIAPTLAGGALPQEVWNWLNTGWTPPLPPAPPAPTTAALTGTTPGLFEKD